MLMHSRWFDSAQLNEYEDAISKSSSLACVKIGFELYSLNTCKVTLVEAVLVLLRFVGPSVKEGK